ncbi:hypothetical protein BH10PSE16_BH10PSE16_11250 [soil metagenome]
MKTKIHALLVAAALFAGSSGLAMAASDAQTMPLSATATPAVSTKLTSGEVRKIDIEQGKLTIKHEAIENLQMPGMTMVFKAADPAMLQKVKIGDKVRFAAEKADGAIVVTAIEAAQ